MERFALTIGVFLAMLSVVAGAFGSHLLQSRLAPRLFEVFEIAVRYQFYHALALILFGLWLDKHPGMVLPAWFFSIGVLIFSGSLYTLAFTGMTQLGAITPIGGLLLILGWLIWGISSLQRGQ